LAVPVKAPRVAAIDARVDVRRIAHVDRADRRAVSPFTPVIDVIAAEWDRPSYATVVRRHHDHRVALLIVSVIVVAAMLL
jgi:hypothetical protein